MAQALRLSLPLLVSAFLISAYAQCTPHSSLTFRSPVTVAQGLAATPIFNNLTTPRGITFDSRQNLLVVERGLGVTAFTSSEPTCDGWLRTIVIPNTGLTQGIQVNDGALYVSTSGQVLRYAYDATTRTVSGSPVVIIDGIPPDGELTTRPILLHPHKYPNTILVSCALAENIDPTARDPASGRSQIRSFPLPPASSTPTAQNFFSGALLVYGIRNPAGFAFFPPAFSTNLWVVDNGASIDNVTGLTPAFVNDNPADELNLVNLKTGKGRFYGFPDCTTIWNPDADPVGNPQYTDFVTGEQFSLMLEPERDDAWCQDVSNNVPPRLSFQAHSVPLDLKFFFPNLRKVKPNVSLPLAWTGDAFVSFHGSFNRVPPTGYGVVRVPFTGLSPSANPSSTTGYSFLAVATDLDACSTPGICIRPVGLAFADDGRLFVSSDSSGELFIISKA